MSSVQALLDQGRLAESRGQRDTARELYERALHSLDPDARTELVAALILGVGRTHFEGGHLPAAGDCVEAVLALPSDSALTPFIAEAFHLRGRIHWSHGTVDAAHHDFAQSRMVAAEAQEPRLAAAAAACLAGLAVVRGELNDAVTLYETSITEYRAVRDDSEIGTLLEHLATLNVDLKRWNAAEHAFAEAIQRATSSGDDSALSRLELRRAAMAVERFNFERAKASCERALDLARRSDDSRAHAEGLALSGVIARELGDLPRAERQLDQAERMGQDLEDLLLLAEVTLEKADLYGRQERHRQTLFALNRAYRFLSQFRVRRTDLDVARRLRRLESGFVDVARRWAQRIESKDHATTGHCDRVADLTCELARRMGVDDASLFWYRIGAILHDIGKLSIPAAILNKNGRLTAEEWGLVKRHPLAGAEMLAEVDFPWEVRPIVESHHECWDGSGYPHGLAGTQIPLAARIFCVADVYDALVSRRSFKQALTPNEAVEVMRRDVGRMFDPAVFRVFEDVVREGVPIPGVTSVAGIPTPPSVETPVVDDGLTGVAERRSFMHRGARVVSERRGTSHPVALLLVDLDRFTLVNDAYGRLQGDDILWAVAKVLQRGVRGGDLIGRRGGDQFLVLLPDTTQATAIEVAERLREACTELRCVRRDMPDEHIAVSVSIGAALSPGDGETIESLLASADRALFDAKRAGRDRVVAAGAKEQVVVRARLQLDQFVGREDDLRALVMQLDAANRGAPHIVSVIGEAGIGKSALVRQLEPEVRLRGGVMVTGRCADVEMKTPLAPWAEILTSLHRADAVPRMPWSALGQLVPELGSSGAGAPARGGVRPTPAYHTPASGHPVIPPASALADEIVEYVRAAARSRLTVVVLEDVHWADSATWNVIEALATAAHDERLLICLTLRAHEARAANERRRRLAQHPRATQVSLQRFSPEELRRWVQALFHEGDLGPEFPAFLFEYTEGIPFYVAQVLSALAEEGGIWYGGTRWEWRPLDELALPAVVGEVLERRLDRLSPTARGILASAAIIGPTFALDLVLSTSLGGEAHLRAAIEEGVSAGVLEKTGDPRTGQYAFTHAFLFDTCRRSIPERPRQRMHEVTARMLELRTPTAVSEIAAHYHASGNDVQAYRYAVLAAERAASVYAHDEAIECLLVAQRHAPAPRELTDIRIRLAELAQSAGRYEYAEEMCDLALEWLAANPDPTRSIRARRMREHLRTLRGRAPTRTLDAYAALLLEADALGDASESAAVLLATSNVHALLADWSLAEVHARKAMDALGGHGDSHSLGEASLQLGVSRFAASPAEASVFFRDALALFSQAGDRRGQARAWLEMGVAQMRAGHLDPARDALSLALDLARGAHAADIAGPSSLSLGELAIRRGDFEAANEWFDDAARLFGTAKDEPRRLFTMIGEAQLARERGEVDSARELFDQAAARARELGLAWAEIVATSGSALLLLAHKRDGADARWTRVNELVAGARPEWWFAGREMFDALTVHMAVLAGHSGVAYDLFSTAANATMHRDAWAAAWMTAECADLLDDAGFPAVKATTSVAVRRAEAMGFRGIVERLRRS